MIERLQIQLKVSNKLFLKQQLYIKTKHQINNTLIFIRNMFWNFKLFPLLLILTTSSGHPINTIHSRSGDTASFLLPNIAAEFINKKYAEPQRSFSAPFLVRNYEDVSIQKRSAESPLRYTVPSFVPNTAAVNSLT